ncbi:hypothetical protein FZI91_04425 [Mycobacterium sp. CBMA271]|uniref:hypothetical protein n=1 Tax=unclassified Mycobacteroides TaxID=2618759 RepID=UPI0012DBF2AF|nr:MULTISPECIES: hypothetical protein [unclassified Mycobacteroides]MUM19896.1 hypothetical protein [Mycobacteroides sp. CBMA 326]MUM20946.1 hypothetical protein [Mycobacteroides sp. CBMA 271]
MAADTSVRDSAVAGSDNENEDGAITGEAISADSGELGEPRGQLTFSVRRDIVVMSVLLALSLAGSAWLGWLWQQSARSEHAAKSELALVQDAAASRRHAEEVALNYSMGAAQMDYKNIQGWSKQLAVNTSPELAKKLRDAATSMEQIIVPLQWTSIPTPITATTRSEHDGVFVVNCFVSVMTKNIQAPDGIQSTATYTVTVNKNDNWKITEVGGVDSALRAGN